MLPICLNQKTFQGHEKMTEAQLMHLAHPYHASRATWRNWGSTVSYLHARETTINEETPGYFRSVRMTDLDTLLKCAT